MRYAAIIALAAAAGAASAAPPAKTVGNVAAGRTKAAQCAGCHGKNGISRNPLYPSLAGQQYLYLRKQLADFRSGKRANDVVMASFAKPLSDRDIADISAFYASLE